jgi:hypothetical protein
MIWNMVPSTISAGGVRPLQRFKPHCRTWRESSINLLLMIRNSLSGPGAAIECGEVVRRQEVLRDAGNSPSITHQQELRRRRVRTALALPHLLLVIDEFGELLTAGTGISSIHAVDDRPHRTIHWSAPSGFPVSASEAGKLRGLDTYLS